MLRVGDKLTTSYGLGATQLAMLWQSYGEIGLVDFGYGPCTTGLVTVAKAINM